MKDYYIIYSFANVENDNGMVEHGNGHWDGERGYGGRGRDQSRGRGGYRGRGRGYGGGNMQPRPSYYNNGCGGPGAVPAPGRGNFLLNAYCCPYNLMLVTYKL